MAFAVTLLGMLVGAINYGNNLAYLLVFLLVGLGLVCMVHTYRNLVGLGTRLGRVEPVFLGEPAVFRLCIDNPGRPPRFALTVRYDRVGRWRRRHRGCQGLATAGPGASCLDLALATSRRGRRALGPVTVETRYPLGLFRAWYPVDLGGTVVVYPRPEGERPLPLSLAPEGEGMRHGPGEDDFSGYRAFHPGDSPRRVDWKAAARDRGLLVKQFQEGGGGTVLLRWSDAWCGDPEGTLSQLCRWLLDAERDGLRYGLDLPGARIPPASGETHQRRCLTALALHGEGSGRP